MRMHHRISRWATGLSLVAITLVPFGIQTAHATDDSDAAVIEELDVRPTVTQAVINWRTDITTTGKLEYGVTPGLYTESVATSDDDSHNVRLKNLDSKTTYYFRIVATTLDGVNTNTPELSFTTEGNELMFSKVDVLDVGPTKAFILGKTTKPAAMTIHYGTAPDALTEIGAQVHNLEMNPKRFKLEGLRKDTTYYFQIRAVRSKDDYPSDPGSAESGIGSFHTTGTPKITSITPTRGNKNTTLTIEGQNFGQRSAKTNDYSKNIVTIGCSPTDIFMLGPKCAATVTSWSDSQIKVKVGSSAKTGRVYVTKAMYVFAGGGLSLYTIKGPTFTVK